jgi:hypothetical protein
MKGKDKDTALMEKLLDRYRLTRPASGEVRQSAMTGKKPMLMRVLKTAGAYSALQGIFLSIYFSLKKAGIGVTIAKVVVTGAAAASLSYGGYYAATAITGGRDRAVTYVREHSAPEGTRTKYMWVDQITLYSGKIIQGAVISRGEVYEVLTADGVIRIPHNQIRMIRPLKIESEPAGGRVLENK